MKRVLAFALLTLSGPVLAADESIPAVCGQIFQLAASAISNKEKGVPAEQLRSALPPIEKAERAPTSDQAVLLRAMHAIVSEVYGGETPSRSTYPTYRAEVCVRLSQGKPVPADFESVRAALSKCAGLEEGERLTCAMQAAGAEQEAPNQPTPTGGQTTDVVAGERRCQAWL